MASRSRRSSRAAKCRRECSTRRIRRRPPTSGRRAATPRVGNVAGLHGDNHPSPGVDVADPLADPKRCGLRHPVVDSPPRVAVHGPCVPLPLVVRFDVGDRGGVAPSGDQAPGGIPQPGAHPTDHASQHHDRPAGRDQGYPHCQSDSADTVSVAMPSVQPAGQQQPEAGDQQQGRDSPPRGHHDGQHIDDVCGRATGCRAFIPAAGSRNRRLVSRSVNTDDAALMGSSPEDEPRSRTVQGRGGCWPTFGNSQRLQALAANFEPVRLSVARILPGRPIRPAM